MKYFNTNHRTTLLWLMVLLTSLSSYAQKMVGDGFGGRAGYDPVNITIGHTGGGILCADKNLYVWGGMYDNSGSSTGASSTPKKVQNVSNVRQFSLGQYSSYIKEDGSGYVFGWPTPYNTALITNAYHTAVSGAAAIVAFVKTDGTVWVGGNNMLSSSCPMNNGVPATYCLVQIPGITNAKRVAVHDNGVAVSLLADGTVKTVGQSGYFPASLNSTTPITVPGLSNIVDVKSSRDNFFALTSSGQVYSWGYYMAMGTGATASTPTYMPTLVTFPAGAAPIKAIYGAMQGPNAFALDENGNLYGWGGRSQDFGGGSGSYISTPQLVATNVRDMTMGSSASMIVKNDGTLWGAGNNSVYALMTLPNANYTTFTQITIPSTMCAIQSYTGMAPCVAGTTAPALTPTTATNSCPTATVNLASLAVSSTTPSGASLIWSTHKTPTSAGDTLTTAQKTAVSTAGKYYVMYYDAANACYSPADSVDITITPCPINLANACPTATVNLTTAISASNMPSGATITWHTGTPATTANQVADPTAVSTSGTYYLAFFDGINNCYGNTSQAVTVTITSCVTPLSANTPAAQTATTGTAKTGNAATELAPTGGTAPYVYSNGAGDAACVAPSGATALTGLTVNADGTYSYTAPTTAGTYYYCIKVCDSATPTPSCIVKTYTLTVTVPACNVTGVVPTFIKN